MFERDEIDVYICVYQVVYNFIKILVVVYLDDKYNEVVSGVIGLFSCFVKKYLLRDNDELYVLINSRYVENYVISY